MCSTVQSFMYEAAKSCAGRHARREVADRGRDDVAAPRVLDRQGQPELDRSVAHQSRLAQPADAADLEVDVVHGVGRDGPDQRRQVGDDFVEDEREGAQSADRQALLEGRAGLLEPQPVEALEQPRRDDGVLPSPATVRVTDDRVLWAGHRMDGRDAIAVVAPAHRRA